MQPDKEKLRKHPSYDDVYYDGKNHWWRLVINDDDEEEHKRTYPSWEKERIREIVPLDYSVPVTEEAFRIAQQLMIHLSQNGVDLTSGARRKTMTDALAEIRGDERGNLRMLKLLWRSGLVTREGEIFKVNRRPYNQKWYLDTKRLEGAFR